GYNGAIHKTNPTENAMARLTFLIALWMLALNAHAQDWAKAQLDASPRHLEWVTVQHGDRNINCFIAYPEVASEAPAVVVIHEIYGLTDWVRTVTDELAKAG